MRKYILSAVVCAMALGLCGCNAASLERGTPVPETRVQNPADDLPTVREYIRQVIREHVSKNN